MTLRHAPVAASIIEDAIEAWRNADASLWEACRLSWEAHGTGYTYSEIGSFVGRDGDTVGTHSAAWELRERLSASIDREVMDWICSKLSVSHLRYAAGWERNVMRWLAGASRAEMELARAESCHTPDARERKVYSWLNDCINREDDTVMSARAFQRELSAHVARLAGADEGRATFTTLESWLPRLNIFASTRLDAMHIPENRRGILREIVDTTKRLGELMAAWREG